MVDADYVCAEVKEEAGGLYSAAFHTDCVYADSKRPLDYFILIAPDANTFQEGRKYHLILSKCHDNDAVIASS